jgi:small basic protein (TIGR04137 family)
MSLDKSLKSASTLARHRNVLNRAERIDKLIEDGRWDETNPEPFGLPKVGHRKVSVGGKTKKAKKTDEAEETKK